MFFDYFLEIFLFIFLYVRLSYIMALIIKVYEIFLSKRYASPSQRSFDIDL